MEKNKLSIYIGRRRRKFIEVPFNPKEYSISKKNSFIDEKIPGMNIPLLQFERGQSQVLKLNLLLDTQVSDKMKKEDVREKYIRPLETLMKVNRHTHLPPECLVVWGSLYFRGVLQEMSKKYTLFTGDGTPVRARVDLTFLELIGMLIQKKEEPQDSPDRRKLFKMTEDSSIWQMAYEAYGDPGLWRVIARANHIDDPWHIEPGKNLIIPVLEINNE
jgi:hypothetical protein